MRTSSNLVRSLGIVTAVALVWLSLSLIISDTYYLLLLAMIPVWAVLGISWNIFSGYSGLVSFGHGAFFGLGAYTVTLALVHFSITPWFGIPLAAVIGGASAAVIGSVTFRLRGVYFALAMLAYPLAFIYVFDWMQYQEVTLPMHREAPVWFMQFSDYRIYLLISLALLIIALAISVLIESSRFGRSLLAIKQNELAAEACGVDSLRWKMWAIVISGALAGAAGGLYAVIQLVVTPPSVFGLVVSAQAMILTLFGGAGVVWGPLIGAAVLVPLSEGLHAQLGHLVPGMHGVVYGVAIILVTLLAPEGIYWKLKDAFARRPLAREARLIEMDNIAESQPARAPKSVPGAVLLSVSNLSKSYGGLRAVAGVSFEVREGEVVGIIGPNGAGKTTLFNLLNGIERPDGGTVMFAGQNVVGLKPNRVCKLGIGRTFQVVRSFSRMTVRESVLVGAYVHANSEEDAQARADKAVEAVGLSASRDTLAGALSTKELRLMELARALAGQPRLVLLDEPFAGLGSDETEDFVHLIRRLPAQGFTVLIIEHTMQAVMSLVDRLVVLDHGSFLTQGDPATVTKDPRVIEAYLGQKWAARHAQG